MHVSKPQTPTIRRMFSNVEQKVCLQTKSGFAFQLPSVEHAHCGINIRICNALAVYSDSSSLFFCRK